MGILEDILRLFEELKSKDLEVISLEIAEAPAKQLKEELLSKMTAAHEVNDMGDITKIYSTKVITCIGFKPSGRDYTITVGKKQ